MTQDALESMVPTRLGILTCHFLAAVQEPACKSWCFLQCELTLALDRRLQNTSCLILLIRPPDSQTPGSADHACECLLQDCHTASQSAGVVHGDTLFLVGNLQSPNPEERPVLPTTIVMCQYHFPTQKWTRLTLRGAPEICHYPLLAAHQDQLILFGGEQATSLLH